jgi:hypothetical protein
VAGAEAVYADPSALLKLYLHQPESAAMNTWRRRTRGALVLTLHGRAEIVNGICLAAFRGVISAAAKDDALASFDEDVASGRYAAADLLWRAALQRAADISRQHTAALGCRTLDVLHVASALELGLPRFLTLDARQSGLARAVGLRLVVLAKGQR